MSSVRVLAALFVTYLTLAASQPNSHIVSGVVSNAAGQPLAGVHVSILDSNSNEISATVTNTAGAFQFRSLPAGALAVVAESAGLASARASLTLASGVSGASVSIQLLPPNAPCNNLPQCVSVRYLRPSQVLQLPPLSTVTAKAATAKPLLTSLATTAATVNSAADFTIQTTIAAPAPPRFGFNFAPQSQSVNNMFSQGGGMDPYDSRFSFNANAAGTTTTLIDNDCASGCVGTDFYQSIGTGYFTGAQARVYHFNSTSNSWQLINSGTVTNFTANSASTNAVDHTITLNHAGSAATQTGDAIWLSNDAVPAIPNFLDLDPRLQAYGSYNTVWTYESGSTLSYMPTQAVNATHLQPYTFAADGPPGDDDQLPGVASPLSLKITDANSEYAGIFQYFLGTGTNTESLQPGHTYQVTLWLKQTGIANPTVYFSIAGGGTTYASTTFTGVTGTWQQFTFQFPGFQAPAITQVNPGIHIDFQAPGTLYIDQVQINDTGFPALSIDPRVMSAWQSYAPSTMRIWTNFGNNASNYSYWGLDSWLANDSEDHIDPGIGNIDELLTLHAHLPSSLAIAKTAGADPWLICNMSLSEAEWGNLIDYLSAPAGTGYASLRPASHPGPYTADFDHIYLEFGNEEWGTQETAVNAHYGQWVHYMLSQAIAGKSYFDPTKIKFIVNGFTLIPSIGSAAAAAAPEASVVDIFEYNSGDVTLIPAGATTYPDAYYQTDLLSLIRNDADYGASLKSLLDAQVAQQKTDATAGLHYSLAAYEGGPGGDLPSNQGDTSLAAAVGNLDTSLYASLQGIQQQNFFLFNFGTGPYTSHSFLWNGFRPHPVWEALQMRNQYANGDMVNVTTNTDPLTTDGSALPLIGTYAFHEVNASGIDQMDVFVLSRDLNNSTPVTLHLPGVSTGTGTLYMLTGDPRTNNDTALTIPITQSSLTAVSSTYQFTMPPGSVYLFQFPVTSYSGVTTAPTAGLSPSSLTFASQATGTMSAAQTVTLNNTGTAALSIASITLGGANPADFAKSTTCTSTLAMGSSCNISITFTPSAAGARGATLTVTDNTGNIAGSPQSVTLAGTGSSGATPTNFTTYLGTYGSGQPTYTANTAVLPLRAYLPGGAAQLSILEAGFVNASSGAGEYTIFAQTDGAGGYTLRLENNTTSAPWPLLSLSPSGATVTLTNPIIVGSMEITAYRFALAGNEFQLDLTVSRSGTFNDQIVIFGIQGSNYSSPWNSVDGVWTASGSAAPSVSLSASTLNFASQTVGTNASQTITVTNNGTVPLAIASVQINGTSASDFTPTNACPSGLGVGASCNISVAFVPPMAGAFTAMLSISDNAANSPQMVTLNGTGVSTSETFTTYLGTYGSGLQTFHGTSAVLPLRAYLPTGAAQTSILWVSLNATAGGAAEYAIYAESDGAGGYTLTLENNTTAAPWPALQLMPSGSTVTLATPITVASMQITAYRFALVGNEFQLDLTLTRVGTFSDQIIVLASSGNNYSSPWAVTDGQWSNP